MTKIVEPRTLSGFMELLPQEQILFNQMRNIIEKNYQKFGFLPIDTPIIESADVLLAKAGGETEKQIYSFEKGDNSLALRFDLTVPLAKYVAKNMNELVFPFRRYQIGKVYRGERPQKGRFREFYQCDIDIIGKDNLSVINEAEIPSVIYHIFDELNIGDFTINISNRKLLLGLLESLNLNYLSTEILRIIDKFDKIGEQAFEDTLLQDLGIDKIKIAKIMYFIQINGENDEQIEKLKSLQIENQTFNKGVEELSEVVKYISAYGVPQKNFKINLSIARGLDYYTGTVYETYLDDYKSIGSICSGGRYDDLAQFYTNSKLPGVGIAIGLTRLFYQLNEIGVINVERKPACDVLIVPLTDDIPYCIALADTLRNNQIRCQVYLEDTKIKNKLSYADKLNIPFSVIIGDDEIKSNTVTVKNMLSGEQKTIKSDELVETLLQK